MTSSMPAAKRRPTNSVALVGFILGIATAIAVLLRPYWLLSDALGIAAIVLGAIGLRVAGRIEAGQRFAIWSITLGLTPLLPLLLALAVRLDYY